MPAIKDNPRLGFIGMGGMGSRMAARLLAAGYDVTIYNRHRERTRFLEEQGAKVALEPGELAAHADIVLSSLADDTAVIPSALLPPRSRWAAAHLRCARSSRRRALDTSRPGS
jgi:3-hydroxyisobutyrate dehydrogenase-like beta-hydroxyacid dehydrogenase